MEFKKKDPQPTIGSASCGVMRQVELPLEAHKRVAEVCSFSTNSSALSWRYNYRHIYLPPPCGSGVLLLFDILAYVFIYFGLLAQLLQCNNWIIIRKVRINQKARPLKTLCDSTFRKTVIKKSLLYKYQKCYMIQTAHPLHHGSWRRQDLGFTPNMH